MTPTWKQIESNAGLGLGSHASDGVFVRAN